MILFLILFVLYLIGCVLCYGNNFDRLQRKFPSWLANKDYKTDRTNALILGLASWVGLLVNFIDGDFKYGLKFK